MISSRTVVGTMFLDLKKAFDTINQKILISKLSKFNLSKWSLSWFKSYLKGCDLCVVINNIKSVFYKIETGIPQVTVLDPILFSFYIHDLREICPGIGLQMYADDTVMCLAKPVMLLQISKPKTLKKYRLDVSCLTLNT